jgi:hypothetical protein
MNRKEGSPERARKSAAALQLDVAEAVTLILRMSLSVENFVIEAVCDCGAVRLQVSKAPAEVNDCQCSWCQRLGALWAYYLKDEVRLVCEPDATSIYLRGPRGLEFHSCKVCGLTTHWVNVDRTRPRMGLNARLLPRAVRAQARVVQGSGPG